jgi:hypothetical protein
MPILAASAAGAPQGAVVPIASVTLPPGSSNTSLTSIPGIYQDLFLTGTVLVGGAYTATSWWFRVNGDGGSNYSNTALSSLGTGTNTSGRSSNNTIISGSAPDLKPGLPSTFQMHIINYANTSTHKTGILKVANNGIDSGYVELNTFLWRSTAAVSQIDMLFPGGNSLTQSIQLNLYGVRRIGQ